MPGDQTEPPRADPFTVRANICIDTRDVNSLSLSRVACPFSTYAAISTAHTGDRSRTGPPSGIDEPEPNLNIIITSFLISFRRHLITTCFVDFYAYD